MRIEKTGMVLILCAALAACGSTPPEQVSDQLIVAISEENQPIADVEGPYGAVSAKTHLVALRVWPDSLDDGVAEANIIVTNQSWNTVILTIDDIAMESAAGSVAVLGRQAMLAALSAPDGSAPAASGGDIELTSEQRSSRAARSQQGAGAGSRQSGDVGVTMMDPAIVSAARRVSSTGRTPSTALSPEEIEERRQAIDSWYLDRIEIYPGDTGVGGISFRLPDQSQDLRLIVTLHGEAHVFDLELIRQPGRR